VLRQGVQGISDIITIPGIINRDFADVKTTMAGMAHAVMGTAVRSGPSRAVEAAQAAMASPLLEAGAIDGARGILINITGSSALKLSEVNEASSLIQSAAHEDANIIFGAVLDERMGEDVKITVIATGFRDQMMPERRARMLSVEEAPVVSVPLVAVPVESPNNWLKEAKPSEPAVAPVSPAPPSPPRFKSEDDEAQGETNFVFTSSAPAVATRVTFAAPASIAIEEPDTNYERAQTDRAESLSIHMEDPVQEAAVAALHQDFITEFAEAPRIEAVQEPHLSEPVASLFNEASDQENRDLDVPAFMRRHKF